jgi:hypothetical protein
MTTMTYRFAFVDEQGHKLAIYQNKKNPKDRWANCTDSWVENNANKALVKFNIFQMKRHLLAKGWKIL